MSQGGNSNPICRCGNGLSYMEHDCKIPNYYKMNTTPTKSPVDTIREALMKVQTVATTTMHRMDHGCVPDPEGETFHALLSAIRAINPSALSSLSNQPAQTEGLEEEWVKARAMEVFPPDEVNDGCPWYGHRRAIEDIAARTMIRHLHKRGYLSLPRQKGEVDMETVIDIRAAIIELMGTGVKVPTTEDLIAYMATSPSNSNP